MRQRQRVTIWSGCPLHAASTRATPHPIVHSTRADPCALVPSQSLSLQSCAVNLMSRISEAEAGICSILLLLRYLHKRHHHHHQENKRHHHHHQDDDDDVFYLFLQKQKRSGSGAARTSCFFILLVLGPLNSLLWYVPSVPKCRDTPPPSRRLRPTIPPRDDPSTQRTPHATQRNDSSATKGPESSVRSSLSLTSRFSHISSAASQWSLSRTLVDTR